MQEYVATTMIDAAPNETWAIRTDAAAYREWNPEIVALDGAIAPGSRITAHVRLGGGGPARGDARAERR